MNKVIFCIIKLFINKLLNINVYLMLGRCNLIIYVLCYLYIKN